MRFEASLGLAVLAAAVPANAGVFTDDLSRCIVQKTTDTDRTLLVKWMFAAVTRNPDLAGMASLSEADRDKLNSSTAALYDRLILSDSDRRALPRSKMKALDRSDRPGRFSVRPLRAN